MNMQNNLYKTIIYFDLFSYPLTALEVWKYAQISEPCSFVDALEQLEHLHMRGAVQEKDGFWFLSDQEHILNVRRKRYLIAERKYRKVRRAIRFLKQISGIRMIAVANTLAWSHARDESDIDLFIVTQPGALWTSRLLGVTPFALLKLRPRPQRERDTFCFSFFASERALDFSSLAIQPEDPYLLYWLATLAPVYDPDGLLSGVWDVNTWARALLPNAEPAHLSARRRESGHVSAHTEEAGEQVGMWEQSARALQLARFPRDLRTLMNCDHRVVVTDELLKFHKNDRRKMIAEQYRSRCKALCVDG